MKPVRNQPVSAAPEPQGGLGLEVSSLLLKARERPRALRMASSHSAAHLQGTSQPPCPQQQQQRDSRRSRTGISGAGEGGILRKGRLNPSLHPELGRRLASLLIISPFNPMSSKIILLKKLALKQRPTDINISGHSKENCSQPRHLTGRLTSWQTPPK